MKPGTLTNPRLWLPFLAIATVVGFASWGQQKKTDTNQQTQQLTDTLPKKKKAGQEKNIRDLDDVLAELDAVDLKVEMAKVEQELAKAMKELDGQKIKMDIEKAMKDIDFSKMHEDLAKAMKEIDQIDFEKIKKDAQESIAKIDVEKLRKELDEVKKIDMKEVEQEMKKVQEEMKNLKPQIEKEMANAKQEIEKARGEIEKAKVEVREYKQFIDDLDKDGLINKKETYSVEHKDGALYLNGKKTSDAVYNKYRSFLDKHKKIKIEKTADGFDIDND